jgi:tRNA-binding EMAP/Myf-like protein
MSEHPSDQAWTTGDHGEVVEPPHPTAALDLRVARVLEGKLHPNADQPLLALADAGEPAPRQVVAGIADKYLPGELDGKHIVIVANIQPAEIRGETSQVALAGAGEPADQVTIVSFKSHEIVADADGITIDGTRATTPRLVVDRDVTGKIR